MPAVRPQFNVITSGMLFYQAASVADPIQTFADPSSSVPMSDTSHTTPSAPLPALRICVQLQLHQSCYQIWSLNHILCLLLHPKTSCLPSILSARDGNWITFVSIALRGLSLFLVHFLTEPNRVQKAWYYKQQPVHFAKSFCYRHLHYTSHTYPACWHKRWK